MYPPAASGGPRQYLGWLRMPMSGRVFLGGLGVVGVVGVVARSARLFLRVPKV